MHDNDICVKTDEVSEEYREMPGFNLSVDRKIAMYVHHCTRLSSLRKQRLTGDARKQKRHRMNMKRMGYDDMINSRFIKEHEFKRKRVWKLVVILRDPLERFLSAYLNKCVVITDTTTTTKRKKQDILSSCLVPPTLPRAGHASSRQGVVLGPTFEETVEYAEQLLVHSKESEKNAFTIDPHWAPQYTFCALHETVQYYDYIIVYDRKHIGKDVLNMLSENGLQRYFMQFGKYGNESMFARDTAHTTNARLQMKRYYTDDLAQRVYNVYRKDYEVFYPILQPNSIIPQPRVPEPT